MELRGYLRQIFRKHKKKKTARIIVKAVIVLLVFYLEYTFLHLPQPVHLESFQETREKFVPVKVSNKYELFMKGTVVDGESRVLLSHSTEPGEVMEIIFESARLDKIGLDELGGFIAIPTEPAKLQYYAVKLTSRSNKTTEAHMTIEVAEPAKPFILRLFRQESTDKKYCFINLKAEDASLVVKILTIQEDSDYERRLSINDWSEPISDGKALVMIVPANKNIGFNFRRVDGEAYGETDFIQSLKLGTPKSKKQAPESQVPNSPSFLKTREIDHALFSEASINNPFRILDRIWGKNEPLLWARVEDNGAMLNVSDLRLYSDRFEAGVSGYAKAAIDGEDINADFFKSLRKVPGIATILGLIDLALLGWLGVEFKSGPTPGT